MVNETVNLTSLSNLVDDDFVFAFDIIRVIFAFCGLSSNFILFVLFFKFPLMNTHANLFLFNLAVTDTCSLIYDVFIISSRLLDDTIAESIPCALESVGMVLPTINITCVCAIAAERCLFICVPLKYHDFMFKWKNFSIIVSW